MSDTDALAFAALQAAVAGTWSIERAIGRGGMGTVYLARDVALDRPVAIKLLDPALAADPEQRARFLREARTGARLTHPHIVPIYDVVERDDLVFFVMGLVDGESLGVRLRREGPLPAAEAERILREVGWALGAAHAAGVLHRDVTVDNILLDRRTGRALLCDFGIAVEREGEAGPLVGTPAYLAPELVHGEPPSTASDLYALGVVGWTALTGRLPFVDDDPARVLVRQVSEAIAPLASAAAATPRRLARAIERLLAKDPASRPHTVETWLAELEGQLAQAGLAEPLERWVAVRESVRPLHALAVTSAGVVGAIGLLAAMSNAVPFVTWGARLLLAISLVVGSVQAGMAWRAARRAARSGYRIEDLRLALDRRLDERRAAGPIAPRPAGRVIRMLGSGLGALLVVLLLFAAKGRTPIGLPFGWRLLVWRWIPYVLPLSWAGFWTLRGLGVVVPGRKQVPVDRRWRLRRAFWHSRLGEWWYRCTALGLPEHSAETTLHRPTEVMLGLQIGDLWRALPPGSRHGLGDLPMVADGLRRRLEEVRTSLAHLEALTPELAEQQLHLRERLERHRQQALGALERLRLVLLRLAGEAAPAGELTRHLHDARELELELLQDLGAHRGVRGLVGRTPSPTPA